MIPGEIIKEYINNYGAEALSNKTRLNAYIEDMMPEQSVEKNITKQAINYGVIDKLQKFNNENDSTKADVINSIEKQLISDIGVAEQWAEYAVIECARGLGWKAEKKIDLPQNTNNPSTEINSNNDIVEKSLNKIDKIDQIKAFINKSPTHADLVRVIFILIILGEILLGFGIGIITDIFLEAGFLGGIVFYITLIPTILICHALFNNKKS